MKANYNLTPVLSHYQFPFPFTTTFHFLYLYLFLSPHLFPAFYLHYTFTVSLSFTEKECTFDELTWIVAGTNDLRTEPKEVVTDGMEGDSLYYAIDPDEHLVCGKILSPFVIMTRLHFTAQGVDFVTVQLYEKDGETPKGKVGSFIITT